MKSNPHITIAEINGGEITSNSAVLLLSSVVGRAAACPWEGSSPEKYAFFLQGREEKKSAEKFATQLPNSMSLRGQKVHEP